VVQSVLCLGGVSFSLKSFQNDPKPEGGPSVCPGGVMLLAASTFEIVEITITFQLLSPS
jgi:hypothetical protein